MTVIPRGFDIFVESSHGGGRPGPSARLRSGGTVIKVVIDRDGRLAFVELCFVRRDETAWSRVDDVVRKNIARHVPLHLELTGTGSRRIVVVESVVDHRAVVGMSALGRIASDGNACRVAVINQIVSRRDVTGGAVLVLTG